MFIVYTEILNGTPLPERWFWGQFETRYEANEVALELGHNHPVYRKVCKAEDAKALRIQNLPR